MEDYLSIVDIVVAPILLIFIYLHAKAKQVKNIETNPSYKYYIYGMFLKIFGGISVCLVYVLYYGGGDTTNYFNDCRVMVNLLLKSPASLLKFLFQNDPDVWWELDYETGYIVYFSDPHAIFVVKLTWVLCLFAFKSFIGQTILLARISFWPIWRLYQVLIKEFPKLTRELAFALFFIPSVFFWGSGLLKDTITFSAVCLFASSYCTILIEKKSYLRNLIFIILAAVLLVKIKPYIFFAMLPGSILWFGGIQLSKINNNLVKSMTTPLLITVSLILGYVMLTLMSNLLGDYSIDKVLEKAIVTQQDLKNERYQGNALDIGDFDASVKGVLYKFPAAINAALFRPYLWESNNLAMLMSGIENFLMLIFSIYLLVKLKVYNIFRLMFRHRILFFTVYFSIFFAFSVGLTTSNFGSLVRYKIPAIPFFIISLIIISATYKELKAEDKLQFQGNLVTEK
jgi:hypothetical protein